MNIKDIVELDGKVLTYVYLAYSSVGFVSLQVATQRLSRP